MQKVGNPTEQWLQQGSSGAPAGAGTLHSPPGLTAQLIPWALGRTRHSPGALGTCIDGNNGRFGIFKDSRGDIFGCVGGRAGRRAGRQAGGHSLTLTHPHSAGLAGWHTHTNESDSSCPVSMPASSAPLRWGGLSSSSAAPPPALRPTLHQCAIFNTLPGQKFQQSRVEVAGDL